MPGRRSIGHASDGGWRSDKDRLRSRTVQEPDEADENFLAWKERMEAKAGKAEVIVSKQRHGPIGKVELAFNPARVRFGNLAPEYRSMDDDE